MTVITLTTDFGEGSPYVAAMKGVILSINPGVRLVDISHAIPPQDIRAGALALADVTPLFPAEHDPRGGVDPGVGTARKIVYAEIGEQRYVCPDNGLVSRLASRQMPSKMRAITAEEWFRQACGAHVSRPRHHGARRSAVEPGARSRPARPAAPGTGGTRLAWSRRRWQTASTAVVTAIDSFGNLVTNITRDMLAGVAHR